MNTPNQLSDTPRTDAAWAKTFLDDDDQCRAGNAATDMRDACATLERELETEKTNRNHFLKKGATLERELAALAAERDELRAELAELHTSFAGNVHTRCNQLAAELAAERAQAKLWEDKCNELIAPHYILDPCLRAAKFREALQFHPVLPTPFWKKYGGPNDT